MYMYVVCVLSLCCVSGLVLGSQPTNTLGTCTMYISLGVAPPLGSYWSIPNGVLTAHTEVILRVVKAGCHQWHSSGGRALTA